MKRGTDMVIVRMTNKDLGFYTTLGPFLARRDIEKELGYKIYDDDGKTWLIALDASKVIGFCYIQEIASASYQIGSCYVVPEYRSQGVFKTLLAEAVKGIKGNVSLITRNEALIAMLQRNGFAVTGSRGSFTQLGKELE